jgi:hypothetical protein
MVLAGMAIASMTVAAPSAAHPPASCPALDQTKIVSTRAGSRTTLVPPGATSLLVCRYSGLRSKTPFRLTSHAIVANHATVTSLAHGLNSLRPFTGIYACPAGTGAAIVDYFRYPTPPTDPVTVALDGCTSATNGHLTRNAATPAGQALLTRLTQLAAG